MKSTLARCLSVGLFLFSAGCYNTEPLTREQLTRAQDRDITVLTRDSLEYKFSKHQYSIVGDSLSGVGVQTIDVWPGENQFKGAIPFSNIVQIRNNEFNSQKTSFIVGA